MTQIIYPRIETVRLRLREWLPNDGASFVELNQDPLVMEIFPELYRKKSRWHIPQELTGIYLKKDLRFGQPRRKIKRRIYRLYWPWHTKLRGSIYTLY